MSLHNIFFENNRTKWNLYLFLLVADGGINLLITFILQQLTDVTVERDVNKLICLCIFCVVSVIGILLVSIALYYTEALFVKQAMVRYKNTVLSRLLNKSCSSFGRENTSTYISALTNDAAMIEADYLKGTAKMVAQLVAFVGTIVVMVAYNPYLTVAALILSAIPILLSLFAGEKLVTKEKEVSIYNGNFVGMIKDMLTGFAVIKSFQAEKKIESVYAGANSALENAKFQRNLMQGKIGLLARTGILISQFGIFITGACLAMAGKGITAGILIAFVNLMGAMMVPVSAVPQLYGQRKAALGLLQKMEALLKENVEEKGGEMLTSLDRGICLESVSFGYTEERNVLKKITLHLEAGKCYAIVGSSGSGKSTLVDVIMGKLRNYKGSITFDGKELGQISWDSLSELISVIQQNIMIFNSSIRDNITMFGEFQEELLQQTIARSGLQKVIAEKGEEYLCGENGCNLSGGERQRISIARCLLRQTPILVSDEATASLDVQTAFGICDTILNMKGITRVMVTHQLDGGLLERYDGIIVMKDGEIEEMGSFQELMERKEYFYSLYRLGK